MLKNLYIIGGILLLLINNALANNYKATYKIIEPKEPTAAFKDCIANIKGLKHFKHEYKIASANSIKEMYNVLNGLNKDVIQCANKTGTALMVNVRPTCYTIKHPVKACKKYYGRR